MQKSKVKTEHLFRGDQLAGGKGLLSHSPFLRPRDSDARKLAPLPFAFCLLTFAFALFLLPGVLHAQGCAMCYTSASAAKAGAKEALANGVLILLVPPMVFFALITVVVYKYRDKFRDPANWRPEHDRELQDLLAPANRLQGLKS